MRKLVITLLLFFILFNIFIVVFQVSNNQNYGTLTGNSLLGTISLFVQGIGLEIFVHSPENITYNFSSVYDNFTINLNTSSDFVVDSWWYTLRSVEENSIIEQNVFFTPNTTFNAVRKTNLLEVYANNSGGIVRNKNVTFFVFVPNSAPILSNITNEILVCEKTALSYSFNATDVDKDSLQFSINPPYSPSSGNFFYVDPQSWTAGGEEVVFGQISSSILGKSAIGKKQFTISVSDSQYSDNAFTNITVIEVNTAPNVANIGAKTVWTQGDQSVFNHQVLVSDLEDGTNFNGNFLYNLTFYNSAPLFTINGTGFMQFIPNESQIGVYNLGVCVTDNPLSYIHPNISICGENGLSKTSCRNFSLTVTNENRAPQIINRHPNNLVFDVVGNNNVKFNITKYDPDGTIPDSYWFVDGNFVEYNFGVNSTDEFNYFVSCGVSGIKQIKAEISDGLLNSSITWSMNVSNVPCPISGGGGGGGGSSISCTENWVCEEWNVCQKASRSLDIGLISLDQFILVRHGCDYEGISLQECGLQTRVCEDLNKCSNFAPKKFSPSQIQHCKFVEEPSCRDGIKNCHSGSCEVLVDCGGPCQICPTCSDGIQNQGEEGVDCGGPCPWICEKEIPKQKVNYLPYILLILLLIILIITIIKIVRVISLEKEARKK